MDILSTHILSSPSNPSNQCPSNLWIYSLPTETHLLSSIISLKRDSTTLQDAFASIRSQTNIPGCDAYVGIGHTRSDIAQGLEEIDKESNEVNEIVTARAIAAGGTSGGECDSTVVVRHDNNNENIEKNSNKVTSDHNTATNQKPSAPVDIPLSAKLSADSSKSKSENSRKYIGYSMYMKATSEREGIQSSGWKMFSSLTSPFGRK